MSFLNGPQYLGQQLLLPGENPRKTQRTAGFSFVGQGIHGRLHARGEQHTVFAHHIGNQKHRAVQNFLSLGAFQRGGEILGCLVEVGERLHFNLPDTEPHTPGVVHLEVAVHRLIGLYIREASARSEHFPPPFPPVDTRMAREPLNRLSILLGSRR